MELDETIAADSGSVEDLYSERQRRVLRLWLRLVRTSRRIEIRGRSQDDARLRHPFRALRRAFAALRAPERRLSIGDLGASLLAPSGNISSLLDRMEADGLVKRVADPADRRRFMIRLTEKGLAAFNDMALANAHWVATAFEAIDDATLDRLHDELGAIEAIHE